MSRFHQECGNFEQRNPCEQARIAANALRDIDMNNSNRNTTNALQDSWQRMVGIFDKVQQNEALHGRYCHDLNEIYETVNINMHD